MRICVRFAVIFYVEHVAVLTMTLSYVRIAVHDCLDFYTAFDSVHRDVLYSQLVTYGVSTKMIAMIIKLYSTVTSRVKVNNTLSDSF